MRTYVHTFYISLDEATPDQQQGWYYAFGCDPACLPESDPRGPYFSESLMHKDIREEMDAEGWAEVGDLVFEHDGIEGEPQMFPDIDQQDEGFREFDANKLDCPFMD